MDPTLCLNKRDACRLRRRERCRMDDIDRAILRELQVDGRIPYADLGPKVGLSPSAARLRLQRLIDAKAVQVVGVTDPMTMGQQTMALLGLRIDGDPRAV